MADGGVGGGGRGEGGFGVLDGVERPDKDGAEFVSKVGERVVGVEVEALLVLVPES